MTKSIIIQIPYYKINDSSFIKEEISKATGLNSFYFSIIKKSLDARTRNIQFTLKILVSDSSIPENKNIFYPQYKNINTKSPVVHIVGAGPSGLFAALKCLELGIKPIVFEQGKDIKNRRRDLANITKKGQVHPTSNYCFGEGGAGTYSDGKLYTRSNKRGDINYVLNYLVYFGASPDILIDAHPHIGTNKLPHIIEKMRNTILSHGGEIYFQHQLADIHLNTDKNKIQTAFIKNLITHSFVEIQPQFLVLATGHSARNIYEMLFRKNIHIEFKPFALGVRVEHSQEDINAIQYHCTTQQELEKISGYLPPARYSLIETYLEHSVYSFCMCPGGIIAPCATDINEIVTNGWSPSKRNNPFANSGIVVSINQHDIPESTQNPLAGMLFQKKTEQSAFETGGRNLYAPAQRLTDFVRNKESSTLPDCSYRPGVKPSHLRQCLPDKIYKALQNAFVEFDKKMKGFITEKAIVVAPESRTSSPVRIPRKKDQLHPVQITNLYPCAEGAGYAGGIMSAAIDGLNIVQNIYTHLKL